MRTLLVVIAILLAVVAWRRRGRWTSGGVRDEWMSERWLAEHRASHTPHD